MITLELLSYVLIIGNKLYDNIHALIYGFYLCYVDLHIVINIIYRQIIKAYNELLYPSIDVCFIRTYISVVLCSTV